MPREFVIFPWLMWWRHLITSGLFACWHLWVCDMYEFVTTGNCSANRAHLHSHMSSWHLNPQLYGYAWVCDVHVCVVCMISDIYMCIRSWGLRQFPLELLHPQNPPDRDTQISRYLAAQIQIEIVFYFECVPRNCCFWIGGFQGCSVSVESVMWVYHKRIHLTRLCDYVWVRDIYEFVICMMSWCWHCTHHWYVWVRELCESMTLT
jgi:hypothetical protein